MELRHRVFARMWAVAALAHLAGNWRYGDAFPDPSLIGWILAGIGVAATGLLLWPRRWLLMCLSLLVPASVVLEAPFLGNHWLLAGFVSVGYVVTAGRWDRFEVAARVVLIVFYSFAAFAKLNTGFLDPATSCGVFYLDQWLAGYGLGAVPPGSALARVAAWGSALIEVTVPVLLVFRRSRTWGVLLAIAFHGFISLDLNQHFFDFTAVLLALFVLYLDNAYFEKFERLGGIFSAPTRRFLAGMVGLAGLGITLANITPLTEASAWWLTRGSFLWWVPYLGLVAWAAVGAVSPGQLSWRLTPVGIAVVGLVFVNGLTPYLELKSAYGWNMYSNLVTVAGDSNHLIVRSTLPLRDDHDGLVRVVETSDEGLAHYAEEGYLLPWPSFRMYLAERPDARVAYERGAEMFEVDRVADSQLDRPVPWWWRWMPLRAIYEEQPDRCQTGFLPAL